jgi:hypothetical protein
VSAKPYTRAERREVVQCADRVLGHWAHASADELAAGLNWYSRARALAAELPCANVETGAGIIAALSPQNGWSSNVVAAWRLSNAALAGRDTYPQVHTHAMCGQAWRIAHGEAPLAVLGGPKVRAFYSNIVGDLDAVTVDVWAARAALGLTRDVQPPRLDGRRYRRLADAYRVAARELAVPACHVQAAVWVHVRGSAD